MNDEKYIELLEKVNQQFSYTWNFPMFLISALAVLVGVIAIVTAIVLFLQNQEYKNRLNKVFKRIEQQNKTTIKKAMLRLNSFDKKAHLKFEEINKELEKTKKGKISKNDLEILKTQFEELKNLQKEKENIAISSGIGIPSGSGLFENIATSCQICGRPMGALTVDQICDSCKNWPGNPPAINIK